MVCRGRSAGDTNFKAENNLRYTSLRSAGYGRLRVWKLISVAIVQCGSARIRVQPL